MARLPFMRRTFRITRVKPDVPRDVAEEIDFYLDMRTEELIAEGLDPATARRQAEAAFGDRGDIEAECRGIDEPLVRDRLRAELFASVLGDVRCALRDLWKRPTFALAVCLTLAVCIALNTAVGSVVHSILLKPLPYPESERLVKVFHRYLKAGKPELGNTVPDYFERRVAVDAFEDLALYQLQSRSVGEPGAIQRTATMTVTPSFFRVLGVEPLLGRTFNDDETNPSKPKNVVISHIFWQEQFGGDTAVLGRKLRIEGEDHTVVGVMPAAFIFPDWNVRLWIPQIITDEEKTHQGRFAPFYQMIARLRPGATIAEAQSQLDAWNEILLDQVPPGFAQLLVEAGYETPIVNFHDHLVRHVKPWLFLQWGGAVFVLLIGGVSLTNLLLVRATGRLREFATRYVLGAGRVRLLRQLLTESLVLAFLGGGLGIAAGFFGLRLIDVFSAFEIPRIGEVGLDPAAAVLILGLAVFVMLVASTVAAMAVGRRDLFQTLRAGASTLGRGTLRLRGSLAAAQIAIACVLLIGAALMTVSLRNLLAIDPGFATEKAFVGTVSLPGERYTGYENQRRFYETLLAEISALPGVHDVAITSQVPVAGDFEESLVTPEGHERQPGEEVQMHGHTIVSPGFFELMDIPLVAGRPFHDADDFRSHPVVIVSVALAERFWGSVDNALGQRVYIGNELHVREELEGDAKWPTVIGVAAEVARGDLRDLSRPGDFYTPLWQNYRRFTRLVARTENDAAALTPLVRERVTALDSELALFWVTTLEETVMDSLLYFRIPMRLLLVFAGVALLLAAIGVYGVLAQAVTQRTREISVRMALGGSLGQIYRWVLGSMAAFVTAGLFLGLLGALSLTQLMTRFLYDVAPSDPWVFLAVALVIAAVAFAASAIPARRATRVDPARALAAE